MDKPRILDEENMNRAQRRQLGMTIALPPSALMITRHNGRVLVCIERPGFVRLTDVEAIELANSLLQLAGMNRDVEVPEAGA